MPTFDEPDLNPQQRVEGPQKPSLLERIIVLELTAAAVGGLLWWSGAVDHTPAGWAAIAVGVAVFAWLFGAEWKVRGK